MKHTKIPGGAATDWLAALPADAKHPCVLTGDGSGWGTTVAWNPVDQYVCQKGEAPIAAISTFVQKQIARGRKVIGYVAYDLGYDLYGIQQTAIDDLGLPLACFYAFDNYLEIHAPQATVVHYSDTAYLTAVTTLSQGLKHQRPGPVDLGQPFTPAGSRMAYGKQFRAIKRYLDAGDVYQVNLTHRLESNTTTSPRAVFGCLAAKPSNGFMAYIEGSSFAVQSASPERFIRVMGRSVETLPIKGTRPRGRTAEEDARFRRELLNSSKDQAELNMITDLLRNDMGKICQVGTVRVRENRAVVRNDTVMHTFSRVTGDLLPTVTAIEAVLSMSPGGSITGCPKKRAMEIIDELEPYTRSVYCGSVIAIEPNGDLDSSIAIRTLIQQGERLVLQVGGGIVRDSEEADEYQETLHKAQGVIRALRS